MGVIVSIEDEDKIRENIMDILDVEGYKTIGFGKPADFIDYVKKNGTSDIDLIIADIMMPGMTGIEMITEISKTKALIYTPVIFLTAFGDDKIIEKAYSTAKFLLTVDYIIKPFQIGWFLAKIKTMVELKKKSSDLIKANEEILKTNLEIKNILDTYDSKNEYLTERLKKILTQKDLEIENTIKLVREFISKIAVNDLASLKFVASIVEKNQHIIENIVGEATEEDQFFKILPKTAEPLRTAIWDIEQTINLFISMGIIDYKSIEDINFEETAFYEILFKNYKNGVFSAEQFKYFIETSKFKTEHNDIILF